MDAFPRKLVTVGVDNDYSANNAARMYAEVSGLAVQVKGQAFEVLVSSPDELRQVQDYFESLTAYKILAVDEASDGAIKVA